MQAIFDTLDPLMEFKPPFIDVTYHREEYLYNKRDSGYYEKVAIRKRPGTVGICASIMHRYGVDAIPHLICGGFSKEETENALIDLAFLGIDNVLALRGDARKFENKFVPHPEGNKYAVDLVNQTNDMNGGVYLDCNIENGAKTNFCIGTKKYQLNSIPRNFFINMPDDLVATVSAADTAEKIQQAGIEWCIHQSKELKKAGVPCLHYYTMGDTQIIKKIIQSV